MIKKIFFALIMLCLSILQSIFLYGCHKGYRDKFIDFYESFGITQPPYSAFVFENFQWFWAFPIISLVLMILALVYQKTTVTVLAIFLALTFNFALYWSAYSPIITSPSVVLHEKSK